MRAGQAGPALGVKGGLVAPVTVRVYFPRPRAGTDRTNGRSWSNQKPLHRGSRTCRPFAPNQRGFKEDRGFIAAGRRGKLAEVILQWGRWLIDWLGLRTTGADVASDDPSESALFLV